MTNWQETLYVAKAKILDRIWRGKDSNPERSLIGDAAQLTLHFETWPF